MKYYKLLESQIDGERSTEKALAIIVGDNGYVIKPTYYYEFVANSQIKKINNNLYVPAWLALKIAKAIDWNVSIELKEDKKQSKPRKTKKEIELEWYNKLLKSDFNFEVPDEYVEYWFEDDTSVYGTRFTTLERLQGRIDKDTIVKINIVRKNGERKVVRG